MHILLSISTQISGINFHQIDDEFISCCYLLEWIPHFNSKKGKKSKKMMPSTSVFFNVIMINIIYVSYLHFDRNQIQDLQFFHILLTEVEVEVEVNMVVEDQSLYIFHIYILVSILEI